MDRRKTDRRGDRDGDLFVLDLQAMMDTLWRRRFLFCAVVLIFLIPGLLNIIVRQDTYKATATLILENQGLNLTDFQDAIPAEKIDMADVDTQLKILQSPTLAHETLDVLDQNKASGEQVAPENKDQQRYTDLLHFLGNLTVGAEGRARVISVTYKSNDPYEAANVANIHANQYVAFQMRNKREKVAAINEWIDGQVKQLKEESARRSQDIQAFRKESGIVLGKNSEDLINQQILDLTAQLVPIETEKLKLQARSESMGGAKNGGGVEGLPGSDVVGTLKIQASQAKQELEALKADFGTGHPSYVAALNRYRQANADLARETQNVRTSVGVDLDSVTQQEVMIRERLEELNREGDELREKQVELESLEAEELANRTMLESFLARSQEIKSQLDLNRADARIESAAEIPTQPSGIRKSVLMIIMALFSVVAGIGIVLLLEMVDRGIEDSEDVKKILNLRLLGALPKIKNPLAETAGHKRSDYTEELKRVYLAIAAKKAPQSILFTAAQAGEGKSTTIVALGRYMASIRSKVVIVDANGMNASIAEKAHTNSAPGLAELLAGTADLSRALTRTESGLAVISSGNRTANPVDILASDAFSRLLETLKGQYDYVLIDCSPVLESTDAEVISGLVDQVILVSEWAKVSKKKLKSVAVILRQYARDVPGVILNKRS